MNWQHNECPQGVPLREWVPECFDETEPMTLKPATKPRFFFSVRGWIFVASAAVVIGAIAGFVVGSLKV